MTQNLDTIERKLKALKTQDNGLEAIALADADDLIFSEHYVGTISRDIYSHTKSFVAMAIGVAIEEGQLDLSDRLCTFFPEYAVQSHDPAIDQVTLKDLLTMTGGFNRIYLQRNQRRAGVGMPDYIQYMFSQKLDSAPGSTFFYTSSQTHLAGCMLARAVKQTLRLYTYDKLFAPMQIGYPIWECDPSGEAFSGSGLVISIEDQIKLGQLCLAGGIYKGRRLVPSSWVEAATTKKVVTGKHGRWDSGYGYQFWTADFPSAYCARGAYGQNTYILPSEQLTIAIQTSENGSNLNEIERGLTEAIFG